MTVRDVAQRCDSAYLSNGLIGIRPKSNPLVQTEAFVSGFVYLHPDLGVESLSPAPYPLETDILVKGRSVLNDPELLRIRSQSLDMASGELVTLMTCKSGCGVTLNIEVLQFASRSVPSVLCQEIKLIPSADADIAFVSQIDGAVTRGRLRASQAPAQRRADLACGFESLGGLSKLGVALLFATPGAAARKQAPVSGARGVSRSCLVRVACGNQVRYQTIAAMVSEMYQPEPTLEAVRVANWAGMLTFDELRDKNRHAWHELWQSRVRVSGDTDTQRVLDAAFFYLHSSVHPSTQSGMAPFGLSQAAHYYGHSFWDTETWSLLPITLSSPATSRSLLEYRLRGLPQAKRLASLYGYRGAQFPWEAAPTSGFDVTPTFSSTGWLEQHITPDVALGFWEYQLATNDQNLLREGTWQVLRMVAEWIESRGIYTNRGFEIRHTMNPNEDQLSLNNNSYMNVICKMALGAAIRCAEMVGATPPGSWIKIRDCIVVPIDRARGIVLPSDHSPSPLSKKYPVGQMDFLTVHDTPLPSRLLRGTFDYEQGLSASSNVLIGFVRASMAATAALLGERRQAAGLFDESWRGFWLEPFGMGREMPSEDYGCFLTNFGSLLQTVMLGFTGIRVREGDWRKYPASLPEGWTRIEIDRLWVKGEPKRLIALDGLPAKLLDA